MKGERLLAKEGRSEASGRIRMHGCLGVRAEFCRSYWERNQERLGPGCEFLAKRMTILWAVGPIEGS